MHFHSAVRIVHVLMCNILGHILGWKSVYFWLRKNYFGPIRTSQNIVISSQNNFPKYRTKGHEQVFNFFSIFQYWEEIDTAKMINTKKVTTEILIWCCTGIQWKPLAIICLCLVRKNFRNCQCISHFIKSLVSERFNLEAIVNLCIILIISNWYKIIGESESILRPYYFWGSCDVFYPQAQWWSCKSKHFAD